ncbi:MAG: hypothetical protein KIT84_22825 [Labilithrix sp.]|nr:hypothetical protein [Labilithrix sp.]MCW5813880.1 hypothetical protein [Labilithrix sp.]
MRLLSYKLRFRDRHVRAVPAGVTGPGVDLRGADADAALAAARPIVAWLEEREPGIEVRSISVNAKRVLVSLESTPRPRVLRFDPPSANELRDAGAAAERIIADACERTLARRAC